MKRLMDWIAGRCGYVPARFLTELSWELATATRNRRKMLGALANIIAQDTPHSNATVKRMVKLARDGLGGAA